MKGRATDEDGGVFRYESIETGTKFGGVIISDDLNLLKRIKGLIENKEISVGGSRTGGYGRAGIGTVTEETDWLELNGRPVSDIESTEFTVALLSDALIRDQNGQLQAELSADAFGLSNAEIKLQKDKTYKRSELVGGFNRKWGLPLPQQVSIKAGSIFTFEAKQKIAKSKIEEWLTYGIGERRVDGFGRIAVNLNDHLKLAFAPQSPREITPSPLASDFGVKNGRTIVNRLLRHKFESRLVEYLGAHQIEHPPSNSQISRLRRLVRQILRNKTTLEEARAGLDAFFSNLRSNAREQFDKARIKKLADEVLEKAELFNDDPIRLGDDTQGVTSEKETLQFEFRLRLIDGVLAKAAKRRNANE